MNFVRRSTPCILGLLAFTAVSAQANTITPSLNALSFTSPTDTLIEYQLFEISGQIQTGDGFTLSDIFGFVSATAPVGWTVSTGATGTPFDGSGPAAFLTDDGLTNVHFTYTGAPIIPAVAFITDFFVTLNSTAKVLLLDEWMSLDHVLDDTPPAALGVSTLGSVNIPKALSGTPTGVPDGGSTAALLGSVLVTFGLLRRRFLNR